jgi:hypothetical protein
VCNKTAYPQLTGKLVFDANDELIVADLRLARSDASIVYEVTQLDR